jgi:hypothetical protein
MSNLDLIDWGMVGFASLWILGLAIVLTVIGFADYHAKVSSKRFREILKQHGYQAAIHAGLVLFCVGLIGSARAWWEAVIWGVLGASFLGFTVYSIRAQRKGDSE